MIYIGMSGYYYPKRKGIFYPTDLPTKEWLPYYAQHYNAIEINNTFYKVPTLKTVEKRYAITPEHFAFSLKVPKTITHEKKLLDIKEELERFVSLIKTGLREKAKCLLFQMPPSFHYSDENLALVLQIMSYADRDLLYVFEFRHASRWKKSVVDSMKDVGAVFTSVSFPGLPEGFIALPQEYIRMHGTPQLYITEYGEKGVSAIVDHIHTSHPEDVFVFFNNTMELAALKDASALQKRFK